MSDEYYEFQSLHQACKNIINSIRAYIDELSVEDRGVFITILQQVQYYSDIITRSESRNQPINYTFYLERMELNYHDLKRLYDIIHDREVASPVYYN